MIDFALEATFIKTLSLISVDKQNLFAASVSFIGALGFNWPFSRPVKLSVSFDDVSLYEQRLARFHFILTIFLDKCQTKRFRMNTLLREILKFCTNN